MIRNEATALKRKLAEPESGVGDETNAATTQADGIDPSNDASDGTGGQFPRGDQ